MTDTLKVSRDLLVRLRSLIPISVSDQSDLPAIRELDALLREPAPLVNLGKDGTAGGVPWRGEVSP